MASLSRNGSLRRFRLLAPGLMMTIAAGLTWLPGGVHSQLTIDELNQSRGGNQGLGEVQSLCSALTSSLSLCDSSSKNGDPCTTCYVTWYTNTSNGIAGNYNSGAANNGDCGDIYNGKCSVNAKTKSYACAPEVGGDTGTACTKPPGTPPTQPAGG